MSDIENTPAPKGKAKGKKTDEKEGKPIAMLSMEPATVQLRLNGNSPLVVHAFPEKAKAEMRDKQQGVAKRARDPKDPVAEWNGARYLMEVKGRLVDGFPAYTIKKSLVSACRMMEGVPMTLVRQGIHINREAFLVPIEREPGVPYFGEDGSKTAPTRREDIVRVGGRGGPGTGTADLRYRPEYSPWTIPIEVKFLPNLISPEQLFNLFRFAGFGCGIGENRPEKTGGTWGCFEISDLTEITTRKPR